MKNSVPKNIQLLSLAFLLIFAGFNGAQQYVTTFYAHIGQPHVGFFSLIIIYSVFVISSPVASITVSRFGSKKAMVVGAAMYAIFCFTLVSNSVFLVYLASFLIGSGAALLWTGQAIFLNRTSDEDKRGTNSGFFTTLISIGQAIGIISLGFLISKFSYEWAFIAGAVSVLIGCIILLKLKDVKSTPTKNSYSLLKRAMTSSTAWRLSVLWFYMFVVFGLTIGIIPIEINRTLGISYIGPLSSLFYIIPIFVNFGLGKLSDKIGRKNIIICSFIISFLSIISLYFSSNPLFLILGIFLMALCFAIQFMATIALMGDISTDKNLEYLAGFFIMIENVGTVTTLILATYIKVQTVYMISFILLLVTVLILLPILKSDLSHVKSKIDQEIG